jgi:hypothetical protein
VETEGHKTQKLGRTVILSAPQEQKVEQLSKATVCGSRAALEELQALWGFLDLPRNPRTKPYINNACACQCPKVKHLFSRDNNYRIKHMRI